MQKCFFVFWSMFFIFGFLFFILNGCAGPSVTTAKIGDITLQVSIAPDPPHTGDNTLKIKLLDLSGKSIKDAMVQITYSMPAMGQMPAMSSTAITNLVADTYQAILSLSMLGSWDLKVEVRVPDKPHRTANFKISTGTKGVTFVSGSFGMEEEIDLSKETNVVKLTEKEKGIIGVRTEPAAFRRLAKEIRAVGMVAYDPQLYVAQEEFIGAVKLNDESLVETARQRLRILGMSEEQIEVLKEKGEPQTNLLLPEGKAWVYANFYEYEAQWLKAGQKVVVRSLASPAEDLEGEVVAIEPIVKGMTRTLQGRIEVDNSKLVLKPQMYVDVYLKAELPQPVLAVPSEAVLDTGVRKLVYVDKGAGIYVGREVKVGPEASGYFPILAGVLEGEKVVSRANFLIDSQSKLTGGASALYGTSAKEIKTEHKH